MDATRVRDEFDRQLRREAGPEGVGVRVERGGGVVRLVGGAAHEWNGVLWSDLDERSADGAIGAQVAWLESAEGRGREFEWKLYSHDRPADLGQRLAAAGFVPEPPETLMVAEAAALAAEPVLPEGVRLVDVRDADGVRLLAQAHERAFGVSAEGLRRQLAGRLAQGDGTLRMVVAMAGEEAVSGARLECRPGTDFAGLWGGGTDQRWRGRGVYRALIAYRARVAVAQGYRFLQVDASDQSRPILARLGFAALSVTTPYVRKAAA
jgi:hypothetical protein